MIHQTQAVVDLLRQARVHLDVGIRLHAGQQLARQHTPASGDVAQRLGHHQLGAELLGPVIVDRGVVEKTDERRRVAVLRQVDQEGHDVVAALEVGIAQQFEQDGNALGADFPVGNFLVHSVDVGEEGGLAHLFIETFREDDL